MSPELTVLPIALDCLILYILVYTIRSRYAGKYTVYTIYSIHLASFEAVTVPSMTESVQPGTEVVVICNNLSLLAFSEL